MLDPIDNGNEIFRAVLEKYPERITNIESASALLKEIIEKTEGMVIVDFLDYGCWDRLTDLEVDLQTGWMYLIEDKSPAGYKPQKDGLALRFKDVLMQSDNSWSGIFIRGLAIDKNTIKRILGEGATNFKFTPHHKTNFAVNIERDYNGVIENYNIFNIPVHSIAIIPKNSELASLDSQELLFAINFQECLNRLEERKSQLIAALESDEDTICEKANTGRRVFEFVLKVECCVLEHKASLWSYEKPNGTQFKKEYNQLQLGDLRQMIYKYKPLDRQADLKKIIIISNKLSHDSGDLVNKQEALDLLDLMIRYTKELYEIVQDHSLTIKHYTSNLKEKEHTKTHLKITKLSDIILNKDK